MSALPVRPWRLMIDQMRDDMNHGAPGPHLEPSEVPRWVSEMNEGSKEEITDMTGALSEMLLDVRDRNRKRLNNLLAEMMGDISADKLCELRDLLRSELTDYCIKQAEVMLS